MLSSPGAGARVTYTGSSHLMEEGNSLVLKKFSGVTDYKADEVHEVVEEGGSLSSRSLSIYLVSVVAENCELLLGKQHSTGLRLGNLSI